MRDFVENEVGSLRDHGAPGISWALLVLCFALAFSPAPQPAGDRAASGSAEVVTSQSSGMRPSRLSRTQPPTQYA